jgi:NADPH-dependent 2,4-dienoyl-CoA reductase/sulfur reductase-like enzyme
VIAVVDDRPIYSIDQTAPQKIMWMAWDRYRRTNRVNNVKVDFYTGMPTMFSVKKYSDALNALRIERGVGGHFQHNLISIDAANRKAIFKDAENTTTEVDYTLLHVTPPMGPLEVLKGSPISDTAGWVDVDQETLRHKKFGNVFSLGDCSSLPTSKTAAAITAQAPVLTENLFAVMNTGEVSANAKYDGYTSCPVRCPPDPRFRLNLAVYQLLTGYGELMLAEFKYGLELKESFSDYLDQSKPHRQVPSPSTSCCPVGNLFSQNILPP